MRATWASLPSTITNLVVVDGLDGLFIDANNLHSETGTASPPAGLRGDGYNVAQSIIAAT